MRQHIVFAAAAAGAVVMAAGNPLPIPVASVDSLPSPAGAGSAEPNFTVAADGRVYLSWLEPTPDSATHSARVSTTSGQWSCTRGWRCPKRNRSGHCWPQRCRSWLGRVPDTAQWHGRPGGEGRPDLVAFHTATWRATPQDR